MDWRITFYLFTYQLLNICVILTFWPLRIMLIIFCEYVFSFLGCLPRSGIAGSYDNSMVNLLRNCQKYCSKWLDHFIFLASVYECSNVSTFLPIVVTVKLFDSSCPSRYEMVSQYGFNFDFLMINDVHLLSICLFIGPYISTLEKCIFNSSSILKNTCLLLLN